MTKTDYPGIDYSINRRSNCGVVQINGKPEKVSYGLISANNVASWIYDEFELNYQAYCPHCASELSESFLEENDLNDCLCPHCDEQIDDNDQCYGDSPDSQTYDQDGIKAELMETGEIWVFASPYVTNTQFCSPCMPGAGNLDMPCPNGPLTFALPNEWFEENKAPYEYVKISA